MVSRADADRLRSAQIGVRRLVERDLAAFWGSLNLNHPEAARDALLAFVPALVTSYGESAASVAADWYDDVRAAERVRGRFRAAMVVPDETEAVQGVVRRAAGALFTDEPAAALASITGRAALYALEGSRQTVMRSTHRDPQASGWQRVARPGACRFCRLLEGRGAVYKEATAHFAAHGGAKGGECNCAAVPSWDRDAPEVDVRLYEASKRTTGMSEAEKVRHNALIQRAVDEYVD
jgi:hypothetical protein